MPIVAKEKRKKRIMKIANEYVSCREEPRGWGGYRRRGRYNGDFTVFYKFIKTIGIRNKKKKKVRTF